MKKHRYFALITLLTLWVGCAGKDRTMTTTSPEGGNHMARVQQVFDAKCTRCHAGAEAAQGLRLDSWEHVMAGSNHGEAVIPFDAGRSLLLQLTSSHGGNHPAEAQAPTLSEAEMTLIKEWINQGARSEKGEVPFADASEFLYVCNEGAALVTIIDTETNLVVRTVDLKKLGFSANAKPHHVVVEPDGSYWYVSLIGDNKVLKFDRDNNLMGQAPFETPGMLAMHPDGKQIFVGRSMSAVNPPPRLGIIQRDKMAIDEVDIFIPRPHALAVDPRGTHVYAASMSDNRLASYNVAEEAVELTMMESYASAHGSGHEHMTSNALVQYALTHDGKTMLAGGEMTGKVFFFDTTSPAKPVIKGMVDTGLTPWHPVMTHDEKWLYIGNKGANTVSVIDMETYQVVKTIEGHGFSEPDGSAISANGKYVYIANSNKKGKYESRNKLQRPAPVGTIVVINTATQQIEKVLEVEGYVTGVGTRPIR